MVVGATATTAGIFCFSELAIGTLLAISLINKVEENAGETIRHGF